MSEEDVSAKEAEALLVRSNAETAMAPIGGPEKLRSSSQRPSARPGGAASLVGTTLSGRYRIERLLGEGGMGAVYQAEHLHMRKRFAVKVLHPEMSRVRDVVARFEREAMAAAHIEHPNVASATDFGKLEDGSFFLVLEYVEGRSLRDVVAEGPLDVGRALHIVRQIAAGLQRAHALNIVHRDLKPENVMLVARDEDTDFVKVLDFGIAKVPVGELAEEEVDSAQPVLTQAGMVYGTPEYMAPEQALGQVVDGRADLYGLGIMAFEMLTGKRPFQHKSKVALLGMQVTAPTPKMADFAPNANVPADVEAMVAKLLMKEADARVGDAREVVERVNALLAQLAAQGIVDGRFVVAPVSAPISGMESVVSAPASVPQLEVAAPLLTPAALVQSEDAPKKGPPVIAVAAGALLVALVGGVFFVRARMSNASGDAPIATASGSSAPAVAASTPSALPVDLETTTRAAIATVERGDYASGIAQLTAIERAHPDRVDVHHALERAYTATAATKLAMQEAATLVKIDPRTATDEKVANDVRNAAIGTDAPDVAFKILESDMGSAGIDVIYDIAYGASGTNFPIARTRARTLLGKANVHALASPPLAITLDLRAATTCDATKKLLDRSVGYGDERTRDVLQSFTTTKGCGPNHARDCYPCLHLDGSLARAIDALERRLKSR